MLHLMNECSAFKFGDYTITMILDNHSVCAKKGEGDDRINH